MSTLSWVLELQDKVSGAAKTAAASLGNVEAALRKTDAASAQVAAGMGRTSGEAGAMAGRFGSAMSSMGGGLAMVADIVAKVALGVAAVGIGLGAAGATYAAEMGMFKENTLFAFKYVTGSQEGALALMTDADNLARSLGIKTTSVASAVSGLMSRGFGQHEAEQITAGMQDIKALNPNARVDNMIEQMAQIKGLGKLQYMDLKQILQSGGPSKEIYAELFKSTGAKDQAALQKLMDAGKVSADEGITAILRAVQDKGHGGPLGSIAAEFAKSTTKGAFDNMVAMVERLFIAINSGGAGSGIITLMNRIAAAMDPASASGQRLLVQMDKLAAMGGELFKNIDAATVTNAVDLLLKSLKAVVVTAQAAMGALAAMGIIKLDTDNADHAIEKGVQDYANKVQGGPGPAYVAPAPAPPVVVGMGSGDNGAGGAPGAMRNLGAEAASGFAQGLNNGAVEADAAGRALAQTSVDAARATLEVHSPSRVFAQMGAYTAIGYAQGVGAHAWRADAAVSDMLAPPRMSGFGPDSFAGAAGRGGAVTIGDIHVTVGGDAAKNPEAVGHAVRREVAALFESMHLELGGGPGLLRCRRRRGMPRPSGTTRSFTSRTGTHGTLFTSAA